MHDDQLSFSGHGARKFPDAGLLATSAGRGWSALAADIRRHPAGEIPDIVSDQLEITFALAGDGSSTVTREGNGQRQEAAVIPGALWLCPPGVHEQSIRISRNLTRVLHIYVPAVRFNDLGRHSSGRPDAASIDYASNVLDPSLAGMATAIQTELEQETAGGRLLIEGLALALASRLSSVHAGATTILSAPVGGLDPRRLDRVLDYIEASIGAGLTIEALAEVACLSPFHFARAFRIATGEPPHRYVAARRLAHARRLLAAQTPSIAEISAQCGFSCVSTFTRAFKRATGTNPAAYRASS